MMPPPPPPPARPATGEKDEVVAPDRKRPWTKPAIRTLRVVGTRTGMRAGIEEAIVAATGLTQGTATYAPSG